MGETRTNSEHIINVFQQHNTLRKHTDSQRNEQYKYMLLQVGQHQSEDKGKFSVTLGEANL
jgi:hypothetical protein